MLNEKGKTGERLVVVLKTDKGTRVKQRYDSKHYKELEKLGKLAEELKKKKRG